MGAAPIVIPRPDPLTILVPTWAAFWGVVGAATLGLSRPATTEGIPTWGVYAFFIGLTLTSAWVLIAMRLRPRLGMELGGWIALGSWSSIYGVWALQALGLVRPLVVVSFLFTICVASFWQAWRLNAWLSQAKE
jgi:hypothetical protein